MKRYSLLWVLFSSKTINFRKYYNQLNKLKDTIAKKRPKLANWWGHHDNTKPYVALTIKEKLLQFDWDILSYLLHSPDLALSNYYLFLLFKKFFLFWKKGIMKLPERWKKMMEQNDSYIKNKLPLNNKYHVFISYQKKKKKIMG